MGSAARCCSCLYTRPLLQLHVGRSAATLGSSSLSVHSPVLVAASAVAAKPAAATTAAEAVTAAASAKTTAGWKESTRALPWPYQLPCCKRGPRGPTTGWGPLRGPHPLTANRGYTAKGPQVSLGLRYFSRVAEAETVIGGPSEGPQGPPSGSARPPQKLQTLDDLLQEENTLSGLFESYNNERPLSSLLPLQQLQRGASRGRELQQEGVLSWGMSPQVSRQVSIQRLMPSIGNCISFREFLSSWAATNVLIQSRKTPNPRALQLMHNIPLSKAVEALVANTPSLYFSIGDFCQALEPLLLQQGGPPGAPQGATQGARGGPPAAAGTAQWGDRQEVRRALEEAFEEMQGSRCGAADALELLLGLSRYCSVDTADRIKACFALFDKEHRGRLNFFVVAAVFHHLHRMLLTPSIVDKFRRAQISFENVDDLALASAVDLFKGKYHFLTISGGSCCTHQGRTAATRATAAAAAAATEAPPPAAAAAAAEAAKATAAAAAAATECARKELFVDTAEEPWKTAAHYAGLTLSFEEFAQECRDTPKEASINATSLLRLPLIVALRGLY